MGNAKKTSGGGFVHLHNHTHYSLLDGLQKVGPMLDRVQELGMPAIAVTDHGTMSGAIEFYKEAKARGIKPIIGMETYVAARGLADKDPAHDKANYHLILLASNMTGYQNLMRLSTVANLEGFYYKPRIDHDLLEKHSDGLIALSGCIGGEVGDLLRQGQYEKAKKTASWYAKVFKDRYFLELQDHGHPDHPTAWTEQINVNNQLTQLSKELKIPCVVTCDAHYLSHADQEAHEVLLCVQTGSFLADEKRMSLKDMELHLTEPDAVRGRWAKTNPEALDNTVKVADMCDLEIELGKILIPKFPTPKGETEKSYLDLLTFQGLVARYVENGKQTNDIEKLKKQLPGNIVERADYELSVIDRMGFNGYFLIVQDFINWGKDRGIIFGPGRGSGAGSVVAYALRITEIEPLRYDLLFERFLNPDRISMPDFDIDIQDTRRDEVIEYCIDKYGKDRVANIVTFGRMAARNAVRDVARVLQVPYAEADRLAKMIPPPVQGRHIPLAESLKVNQDLAREYKSSESAKRVFDLAIRLEGTIRSHGVHAAGVVIAPDDIVKFTPLEMAQKGVISTQYSMGPVEELGLLKMDFLGLSNLTIIKNALRIIKKVYSVDIELNDIPKDDTKTFELLQQADTTGVFQLESSGMKRYLKELKPTLFEDIIAMVSLYRPGPMSEIPRFIEGKNNPRSISFLHKSLEPILQDTYGVMVYQEQIIKLLQLVAGYTPGEADLVRKAIGKKKRDIMRAEEPKFIKGCMKQGLTEPQAERLWAQIQPFADYSFNKAHATCYAQIAYWTAYLKAHYPDAFMAALMTSDFDNTDRLAIEINECAHLGLKVLPPDVNESFVEFAIVPGKSEVRFGMSAIKNVGVGAVEEITRVRDEGGKFSSLEDFFTRVNSRVVNRKVLESLIKTGAFDSFGERGNLLDNIDSLLAFASKIQREAESGQTDLFGMLPEDTQANARIVLTAGTGDYDTSQYLAWERELLGLYLSEHPLDAFRTYLEEKTVPLGSILPAMDGKKSVVGGNIISTKSITTKNGKQMAFVRLGDLTGEIEVMVFPKLYEDNPAVWVEHNIVTVEGKIDGRDRDGSASAEAKLLASSIKLLNADDIKNHKSTGRKKTLPKTSEINSPKKNEPLKRLYIRVSDSSDRDKLGKLKGILDDNSGKTEVVLVTGEQSDKRALRIPGRISESESVLKDLAEIFGDKNIVLK